jgi:pyridoxine 5-phosphate synthase
MTPLLYLSLDSAFAFQNLYERGDPSLNSMALLAEWAGVSGVSLSARESQLPFFMKTMQRLKEELNVRINAQLTPDLDVLRTAFEIQPDRVTLIPPRWVGASILGGLDRYHLQDELRSTITQLHEADIEVALQIEPKIDLVKQVQRVGADVTILSTHALVSSSRGEAKRGQFSQLMDAAVLASRLGMKVGVSGGIDLTAGEQISRIRQVSEFHIGQSLTARSILRGVDQATRDFLTSINKGRQNVI